ncbi:conjugal transfer protein TraQ [Cronobacter sakazakii]|uniref:conjugal transfer protein TraQ n=1 Tax=Cronobacter sakazakii TaxID=28141 RepID=UPI0029386676|nr:conjugal transfer protein TraQ [Cronobacter sakazakii]EKS1073455.1 conjugal transfer protein TraQ [Cronobacter sakazakii]EKS1087133.1 conjugal transfer protein TraQ [Cronobacter sakazakii]ELQ5973809.1 conjugal transfer protein TraQ [Cronobacter sakazakii]ELQ6034829.1 conjugal transfer protein TraQ [Cronobacter sakazakii]ELQ6043544.1 conjugal transfer protein TraQ [Cronobacter sakazakii]
MDGSLDGITMLSNLASGLQGAGIRLALTLGVLFAVIGLAGFLARQSWLARKAPGQTASGGSVVVWILLCASLAGLDQLLGAAARQLGWQVSFDAISYVNTSTFGQGAVAANALLTLLRMFGVWFALNGVMLWRRSRKDGHTGLTAGNDVNSGTIKFIIGVMMICNPYLLDSLQKTLGIH